jgi:alpha-galactosidase
MGAHIGGPVSHSTGRRHDLSLRAGVAVFGHLGIEWDITTLTESESAELAVWIDLYKSRRHLFHTGTAVHVDHPDPAVDLRGVVSSDQRTALYVFTQVRTSSFYPVGPLRFAGLDDESRYQVRLLVESATGPDAGQSPLSWSHQPLTLTGRALRTIGVQGPVLFPEHLVIIEITSA